MIDTLFGIILIGFFVFFTIQIYRMYKAVVEINKRNQKKVKK